MNNEKLFFELSHFTKMKGGHDMNADIGKLLIEEAIDIGKQLIHEIIIDNQSPISMRAFEKKIDRAVAKASIEKHLNREQLQNQTIEMTEQILARTAGISKKKMIGFDFIEVDNSTPNKTNQMIKNLNDAVVSLKNDICSIHEDAPSKNKPTDNEIYEIEDASPSSPSEAVTSTTYSESALNKLKKRIADIEREDIRK